MVKCLLSLVEEYIATNDLVIPLNPCVEVKWHPPDAPKFKMNVDGAVFLKQRATGLGMVLRDSEGKVFVAMSKRLPVALATLEAEAKCMEEAALFAWEMGFREVIFEMNSFTLSRILTGILKPSISIETVTITILSNAQNFRSISFTHIRRARNRPTYFLAQFAKQIGDFVVWFEKTPYLIECACTHDVSWFSLDMAKRVKIF